MTCNRRLRASQGLRRELMISAWGGPPARVPPDPLFRPGRRGRRQRTRGSTPPGSPNPTSNQQPPATSRQQQETSNQQLFPVNRISGNIHGLNQPHIADVHARIGAQHNQVSPLPNLQSAQIFGPQEFS